MLFDNWHVLTNYYYSFIITITSPTLHPAHNTQNHPHSHCSYATVGFSISGSWSEVSLSPRIPLPCVIKNENSVRVGTGQVAVDVHECKTCCWCSTTVQHNIRTHLTPARPSNSLFAGAGRRFPQLLCLLNTVSQFLTSILTSMPLRFDSTVNRTCCALSYYDRSGRLLKSRWRVSRKM